MLTGGEKHEVVGGPHGPVTLRRVLHIPTMAANLLSGAQADKAGYRTEVHKGVTRVKTEAGVTVMDAERAIGM